MNFVIRQATENDLEFLISSVIEAEKSGFNMISYCTVFAITENEFRDVLVKIFDADIGGQELRISNFLVAEVNGLKVAALSGWIEMEEDLPSNIIKTNLLMHFLNRQKLTESEQRLKLMGETNMTREPNTLQVEIAHVSQPAMYQLLSGNNLTGNKITTKEFRELRLIPRLIEEHIRLKRLAGAKFDKVQAILYKNNVFSRRALESAGLTIVNEQKSLNPEIFSILPSDAKILMEKKLTN